MHSRVGKSGAFLALVLAAGCQAEDIGADEDLSVGEPIELAVQVAMAASSYAASEAPLMDVTYTNEAVHPVKILSWTLPGDDLWEDLFTVTVDGEPADYVGPIARRAAPTDKDFVVLQPGESFTGRVDLAHLYDFSTTGNYEIELAAAPATFSGAGHDGHWHRSAIGADAVGSNHLTVFAEGRSRAEVDTLELDPYYFGIGFAGGCTGSEKNALRLGMQVGEDYAKNAVEFMKKTPGNNHARYKKWFGKYTAANWRWVKQTFDWLLYRLQTEKVTLHCDCDREIYAYVYRDKPYDIYICNLYWDASKADKGGTIIHEMSHFRDVNNTLDVKYGETACKQLAKDDPNSAAVNADSYAYFCEKP